MYVRMTSAALATLTAGIGSTFKDPALLNGTAAEAANATENFTP